MIKRDCPFLSLERLRVSEKNTIIELKDVSFAYSEGAERALDHVDLAVREGEFVGVIGPSGAGTVSYTHLTLPTN